MAARTPRAGTTLCSVSIGHRDFVMPLDKGLKLIALLKDATECDRESRSPDYKVFYYVSRSQPAISMEVLAEGQFKKTPSPERHLGDDE